MKKMLMVLGVASTVLLAGCATTTGGTDSGTAAQVNSGFLSDYSKLRPVEGKEGIQRYLDRSTDLKPYAKIFIDPVQVFLSNDPEAYKGVQPDVLKRIADSFSTAFASAVSTGYQVVNAPGPDVLRVRLAITGIQPVSPPLGVTDFIPIKAVFNAGRAAAGAAPRVAEISAELEVLDGQGRPVAAAVATRKSDATLPQNDRVTWNDLSPIVNSWAKQFRQGLDELRGMPVAR
ncbi:MAG: DUF3313 domain-containing protein [Propionivibrio sp.]